MARSVWLLAKSNTAPPPVDHARGETWRARRSGWWARDGRVGEFSAGLGSDVEYDASRLRAWAGSLRIGAGGVRSEYLLAGVDVSERIGGAWIHEKMD
jgi:hypothetical protein